MNGSPLSKQALTKMVCLRLLVGLPVLLATFFVPAGTFAYWEAWVYLAVLLAPMLLFFAYLIRYEPDLLERRMRFRERETAQRRIQGLGALIFLIAFLLPGFDRRWEWSQVPVWVVIVADVCVALGYGMIVLVMRENRYASRVIEVAEEQQVISTGPYARVRHPMYAGALFMYIASPLALGSYWAVLPAALMAPILVARILNEEQVLERQLKGYREYTQRVRYRLVPGLW